MKQFNLSFIDRAKLQVILQPMSKNLADFYESASSQYVEMSEEDIIMVTGTCNSSISLLVENLSDPEFKESLSEIKVEFVEAPSTFQIFPSKILAKMLNQAGCRNFRYVFRKKVVSNSN